MAVLVPTNLASLPQIPAGTAITIGSAADWDDSWYVSQPGYPAGPISTIGTLSASSTTVTALGSANNIYPNMVASGPGITGGSTVVSIDPSASTLVLSAEPTLNLDGIPLAFYAPPLDLTGIVFTATLGVSATSPQALLVMTIANGLMVNGATGGTFGFDVEASQLPDWPPGLVQSGSLNLVLGIHATDYTGVIVDLCESIGGYIPVTVYLSPDA